MIAADNYSNVTLDDSHVIGVLGCTDAAFTADSAATTDDGSCLFL